MCLKKKFGKKISFFLLKNDKMLPVQKNCLVSKLCIFEVSTNFDSYVKSEAVACLQNVAILTHIDNDC